MNDSETIASDRHAFRRAVRHGQPYKPLYVKIKIVWSCNLRCGMCNHWRDPVEPPLDLNFFRSLVDDLARLGCQKIHLTGGEPLLRPNLEEFMADITSKGIRITMTTNGTLITAERGQALGQAGLRKVNLSIDSPDAAIHDQIRGVSGSWERAIAGFQHLRPWMKPGKMRLNTVIGQLNYESLVDLPDLAVQIGGDRLNLIPLDQNTSDLQRLTHQQILDYNDRIAPVLAEKALRFGLIQDRQEAFPFGMTPSEIRQSEAGLYARGFYNHHRCFAPWTHALVDHVGRVSLCCMMPNKPIIGDLRQQTFEEIWTGEAYAALRQVKNTPQFEACQRCDMFLQENRQLNALSRRFF
jgi:radical SAM protein with 4Fe4S-binding SPASM domain